MEMRDLARPRSASSLSRRPTGAPHRHRNDAPPPTRRGSSWAIRLVSALASLPALLVSLPSRLGARYSSAFFLFGLLNNSLYVVILTAALELLPKGVPTGVVAFANIAPALVAKAVWPYLLKGHVRYARRVAGCTALSAVGMMLIAMFPSLSMRLLGISLASFSSGLGELTFLQLSTRYGKHAGVGVGWFASGTGAAGLVGASAWWIVRPLGVKLGLSILTFLPFVMGATYFVLLPSLAQMQGVEPGGADAPLMGEGGGVAQRAGGYEAVRVEDFALPDSEDEGEEEEGGDGRVASPDHAEDGGRRSGKQRPRTMQGDSSSRGSFESLGRRRSFSFAPGSAAAGYAALTAAALSEASLVSAGEAAAREEEGEGAAEALDEERPPLHEVHAAHHGLSFARKMELIRPMMLTFILPLVLVYLFEYTINQGVAPTLLYPVPTASQHPLLHVIIKRLKDYYPLYQLTYQTFVFLSRSSISILRLPPIPKRYLWWPAALQAAILALLVTESLYGWFRASIASPLVIVLVCVEGLAGGGAYVSVFYQIGTEHHDASGETTKWIELPPEEGEEEGRGEGVLGRAGDGEAAGSSRGGSGGGGAEAGWGASGSTRAATASSASSSTLAAATEAPPRTGASTRAKVRGTGSNATPGPPPAWADTTTTTTAAAGAAAAAAEQEREFRIGCVGVGDSLGILLAALAAMPLELALCEAQVRRGRTLCREV